MCFSSRLVNSVICYYIFLSQVILLRWSPFLLPSLTDSNSPALSDLFLYSEATIGSTMAFPPLGILIMLLS